MKNIKIRKTTYILVFLCSLLVGLFMARFTTSLSVMWLFVCVALLPLIIRKSAVVIFALIIVGILIGWWRGGVLQAQLTTYSEHYFQNVTLVGRATEDAAYGNKGQLTFTAEHLEINGQSVPGKIKISGYGTTTINRHDIISARGKLYPSKGGRQANVSYADIDIIARASSPVETFRKSFISGMQNALPEPAASFGTGLLVGQRSLLPDDIALILTAAGLTHIVAVSGYNLTIIVRGVTRALKKFSRFQILSVSLGLIYIFILVTGFSPSIVRAAWVSGLGLLAWYFGRNIRPLMIILLVAAGTAYLNPLYVWGDIGWYLSFLAFFGVLVVAPTISKILIKKDTEKAPLLLGIVIESFAAQIMTVPLIMFIFARLSIIGLLANIIVVPMVPFAMLFSLFAGIAGMVMPAFSGWVALPARFTLNTMLGFAEFFAKVPHANIIITVSAVGMMALYLFLLILIIGLRRRVQSVTIKEISS